MFKILIITLFIAAIIALFSGLFFILRDRSDSNRTVTALSLRILFCLLLLGLLLFGLFSGHITPHRPW